MGFKQVVSPISRAVISVAKYFIPLHWVSVSHKYLQIGVHNDLISDKKYYNFKYKNRSPDNYKFSDVNNLMRGILRISSAFISMVGSLTFLGTLLDTTLTGFMTPFLGSWAPMIVLIGIISVSTGLIPNIVDKCVKEAIRLMSKWCNKGNDGIINASYPEKYKPYHHDAKSEDITPELAENLNLQEFGAMKALFDLKQIWKQPKGYSGFSPAEKLHSDGVNFVIKYYRNHPRFSVVNQEKLINSVPEDTGLDGEVQGKIETYLNNSRTMKLC